MDYKWLIRVVGPRAVVALVLLAAGAAADQGLVTQPVVDRLRVCLGQVEFSAFASNLSPLSRSLGLLNWSARYP